MDTLMHPITLVSLVAFVVAVTSLVVTGAILNWLDLDR